MQKLSFYLLFFLLPGSNITVAQTDIQLQQRLRNKANLTDIVKEVNEYYKNPVTLNRLGVDAVNRNLKHWKRWEWYMSSHLGPNGEFVNINKKMLEATGLQQKRALNNSARTNAVESASGNWVALGPYNTTVGIGRVDRLAFHPNNANIVYAGTTAGGLWRTTDAGANWTNISPDISSAGISGIAIDPSNTSTIYLLTGDGDSDFGGLVDDYGYMRLCIGVLKSTDGGSNWKKMGDFPGANYNTLVGYRLVLHPTINNTVYACTSQGLYWSLNGGQSWALLKGGSRFFNLKFRPGSGSICYATGSTSNFSRSHFWRSTTSGFVIDTINAVNNQINNPTRRAELAVAPSNPNLVYLLAGGVPGNIPSNPVPNQFKGLFQSNDGGLTFSRQSNTPNILGRSNIGTDTVQISNYALALAVSNTNSATVITGAVEAWRSLNSGNTWTFQGNLHDDVHDLAFNPVDNKLWAATDGGVYSSTDNGTNWTSHFQDMNISQFYRMAVSPDNYLDMIAGAQDNSVKRRSGGTSFFDHIATSDGFAVGYDVANADILYAITNQSVNRSLNGGNNFSDITPPNTSNPFSMSMAVHTSLGNALFIGSDSLWRTTNGGINWAVTGSLPSGWFIRTCPSNGNRVYAAGGNSYQSATGFLFRSDDGGVSWPVGNILSSNPTFPNNYPKITSINVDPTSSLSVWVTFGGFTQGVKVYSSNDAGATWVNRSGTLPNVPINCVALDNNNNAYIGTDNGVYYRGTNMNDWIPFYNNLPYVPVTELIISEAEGLIRASTFGRGIWSSSLRNNCSADLNITGTLEGQEFYEVSNSITSTAFLDTSEGTKVQMRGGFEVHLQPGFTATEATEFKALIGPCGGGSVAGFKTFNDATLLLPMQFIMPSGKRKALIHIKRGNGDLETILTVMEPGDIQFVLCDAAGNRIQRLGTHFYQKGVTEKKWMNSLTGIQPGLYYLHLIHNGVWQHLQEIEIK